MRKLAMEVYDLSKQYRLGQVGTGTIGQDLKRWWHLARGKEDPLLKVGERNVTSTASNSGYVWALHNINFEVEQGEILGIIGGNGAGKSTLLKILSQVTSPTTGGFRAKGRIASLLEVGTGFHDELTGRENIFLNGTILGMTKAEVASKLDEIVEFSGVQRYLDTPVKRYSSGMRVRLAFAVAAHLEPDILIVDEVLAVGDIKFQKKAIGKMKQVSETSGRTVLFVSHDMDAISRLCSRVIVLESGHVSFDGPTQKGISVYSSQMIGKSEHRSIADRTDRKGRQQLKFVDAWLEDEDGEIISAAMVGKPLNICLTVENRIGHDHKCSVGLAIKDTQGEMITMMSSWTKGKLVRIQQTDVVRFQIDKLTIPEGEYVLNLYMENGTMGNEIQDHLEDAFVLHVQGNDFYNSGQVASQFPYKFYLEYQQEVSPAKNQSADQMQSKIFNSNEQ